MPVVYAVASSRDSPRGEISEPGPPSTRPFASGITRFSEPWRRSSTSATDSTRGHTLTSRRSSHASEAFAPLPAGTNGCRLRRSTRTLPPRGPASRNSRAPACAGGLPLRGRSESRAGKFEQRRTARSLRVRASPPRDFPGTRVTGPSCPRVWKTCVHAGPAETLLGLRPRERAHRRESRGAFHRNEIHTRAKERTPPCAPGPRLRHAASVEAWLGRTRAFWTPFRAPSSDEDSARGGSTRRTDEGRSSVGVVASQRPSRLLRPNQLAG